MTEAEQAELAELVKGMHARRERRAARVAQGLPAVKGPRMHDPWPEVASFAVAHPEARMLNGLMAASCDEPRLWGVVHAALACFRDVTLVEGVVVLARIRHRQNKALVHQFVLAGTRDVLADTERRLASM
jgi:hypothetical protein